MLKIKNLSAGYRGMPMVFDFSCQVNSGEIISIVGPNGSGKSTLLKTISGLLSPLTGEIEFMGERIDGMLPHRIVSRGIAYVQEGRQVFNGLTVRENLMLGAYTVKSNTNITTQLKEVMSLFPILEDRLDQQAETLSVGEQQMLAIARALMSCPRLLLVDELSFGLAPVLVGKLLDTFRLIRHRVTILLVEQNAQEALEIADRGYVMQNGHTVLSGTGQELLASAVVRKAYMGM